MTTWLVLGTGTEIGKTHVTRHLLDRVNAAVGLKPIESGVSDPTATDAAQLGSPAPLYSFEPPISPHLAARLADQQIELAAIRNWVEHHRGQLTLVETAGGAFTPLSDELDNLDLVSAVSDDTQLILVARNRLGVLHDVRSTLAGMGNRGHRADIIAVNTFPEDDDTSLATNVAELRRLCPAQTVFDLPAEYARLAERLLIT